VKLGRPFALAEEFKLFIKNKKRGESTDKNTRFSQTR